MGRFDEQPAKKSRSYEELEATGRLFMEFAKFARLNKQIFIDDTPLSRLAKAESVQELSKADLDVLEGVADRAKVSVMNYDLDDI